MGKCNCHSWELSSVALSEWLADAAYHGVQDDDDSVVCLVSSDINSMGQNLPIDHIFVQVRLIVVVSKMMIKVKALVQMSRSTLNLMGKNLSF